MKYFVYLIKSSSDGSRYIGQTSNLRERIKRHNSGQVRSTKYKIPWKIIKFEEYLTRREARFREHSLKQNTSLRNKFYGD